MGIQVVAHTSFIGHTGYANHSRNFFTHLNKTIPVRVRNFAYVKDLSYLREEERALLIEQEWQDPPYKIGTPFVPNPNDTVVDIVLNESNHYYFYDKYDSPMIAYNVWESTKQMDAYFNRILQFDQFWCPTEWQRQCTIEQGYPEHRVKVVPEAVNGNLFRPIDNADEERKLLYAKYGIPEDTFTFMIFGRWDYRKSITELFQAFIQEFKDVDNVMLIASVDNPFSVDGLETTEERMKHYKVESDKIKVLHFPDRPDYIKWLQLGNVYLSCSRSEGWNLPLMEAISCGTPSICSGWGAQLEFADGIAHTVNVPTFKKPNNVFMMDEKEDIGVWGEPDFDHLQHVMKEVYDDYSVNKTRAVKLSKYIREIYTWDNVAKIGANLINELVESQSKVVVPETVEEPKEDEIKLNLGCGNDIRPGYINIDRYNNTGRVDMKCDIGDLPFEDGSVDEILTSHVFEHIGIMDMYSVLSEWRRALRDKGRLVLYLPDLEHEVNIWLNAPDDKKWLEVHRIFGAQSHPGNTHFCGFNPASLKSFLESFNFYVDSIGVGNRGFGQEIQCFASKLPDDTSKPASYTCHFVDGPFIDIQGDPNDKGYYIIDFLDPDNDAAVHQTTLSINCWTRPFRKYFTNWLVKVSRNGIPMFEHKFDLKGKNALISFDTKSLGDTLAWIPYVNLFAEKHKCNVIVATFHNYLFKGHPTYKNIKFVEPGQKVDNLYASYSIGCYDGDMNKNLVNWRTVPLQKVSADTLGVEYKEIIPDLVIKPGEREIKEKYVTLSEWSTFQCKHWNYQGGWQQIVDWFNDHDYKVVVISKEETNLKNVINRTNRPMEHTITNIYHSEMFLGVSAGPSWIAWALRKPVVMISGYSHGFGEFSTNIERIINEDVCHGCFNQTDNVFDRGDWLWCPHHKGTDRQFECTKSITPERVIESIERIIKRNG